MKVTLITWRPYCSSTTTHKTWLKTHFKHEVLESSENCSSWESFHCHVLQILVSEGEESRLLFNFKGCRGPAGRLPFWVFQFFNIFSVSCWLACSTIGGRWKSSPISQLCNKMFSTSSYLFNFGSIFLDTKACESWQQSTAQHKKWGALFYQLSKCWHFDVCWLWWQWEMAQLSECKPDPADQTENLAVGT